MNKQILIGNVGKEPEVRTFQDGSKTAHFTVAVTEKGYTTQSGQQIPDHTEWFNILVRGKRAEVAAQYLHKGDKVYIEGKTYTGEYQDQSGQQKRYTEVRCEVLELLTPKSQSQQQQAAAPQPQYQQAAAPQPQYQQAQYQQAPQPQQQAPQQQAPQQTGVFGQPVPSGGGDYPW